MSSEYQHACERAQLFGQPIPSEEEWLKTYQPPDDDQNDANQLDDDETAVTEDLELSSETSKRIGGGLDELTSILSSTQRKINRFKTVCGSLGTMLKIRRGSQSSSSSSPNTPKTTPKHEMYDEDARGPIDDDEQIIEPEQNEKPEQKPVSNKQIDIGEKMGSHLNKLDSLISKAENAQYSMAHQTKQMRRIIK